MRRSSTGWASTIRASTRASRTSAARSIRRRHRLQHRQKQGHPERKRGGRLPRLPARPYPVADYVAVNLSSPNTPGLRDLQGAEASARLLDTLKKEQQKLAKRAWQAGAAAFQGRAGPRSERTFATLPKVFLDGGLDGLIATNTTLDRAPVAGHPRADEAGGLSGQPLKNAARKSSAPSPATSAAASRSSASAGSPRSGRRRKNPCGSQPCADLLLVHLSRAAAGPAVRRCPRPPRGLSSARDRSESFFQMVTRTGLSAARSSMYSSLRCRPASLPCRRPFVPVREPTPGSPWSFPPCIRPGMPNLVHESEPIEP